MNRSASGDELKHKVWQGRRINAAEAVELYHLPLAELGRLADRCRELAKAADYAERGNQIVTYHIDRNINYTNICQVQCRFCAFYRALDAPDAYVISRAELDAKIEETLALGGRQILLQGGNHPTLPFDWYLDLLAHIKTKFPSVHIHAFSPSELVHFRNRYHLSFETLLTHLVAAGLGSLPGGGAEILVDRVRRELSPGKGSRDEWLEAMATAHRLGLKGSATMMFGHIETLEERIEHLEQLRVLQDRTGGFVAFIGWTYQTQHTQLGGTPAGPHVYLRTQALSRIYLDNFPNVQSSWVTQGPAIGQMALKYGANDFGSIMIEENVVAQAGTAFRLTVAEMRRLISDLGYEPRERDFTYRLVDEPQPVRA